VGAPKETSKPIVGLEDWCDVKEAIRNYVFQNFNPGLLSPEHPLRRQAFENITSTAGLFLALEPKVFVTKIRCRIFRTWKAAEDHYADTLREAKRALQGAADIEIDADDEKTEEKLEEKPRKA